MKQFCIGAIVGMTAGICVGGVIVAKNKNLAKKIDDSRTTAKQKLNDAKLSLKDKFNDCKNKNCDCGCLDNTSNSSSQAGQNNNQPCTCS